MNHNMMSHHAVVESLSVLPEDVGVSLEGQLDLAACG